MNYSGEKNYNCFPALFFLIILALTFFKENLAESSEIDSFTDRNFIIKNSDETTLSEINRMTTDRLLLAVLETNKAGKGCEEQALIKAFEKKLAGYSVPYIVNGKVDRLIGCNGFIEHSIEKGHDPAGIYKNLCPFTYTKKGTIYEYLSFFDSPPISIALGSLLKVEDYLVSSDKFGHFISVGIDYYLQKDLDKALKRGKEMETGVWGTKTSGIVSYGDLAANFGGYTFYERLFEGSDSPVQCVNGNWTFVSSNAFQWKEYITPAWDEAINCSLYPDKKIGNKIKQRIIELQKEQKTDLTCPVDLTKCRDIIKFYRKTYGDKVVRHLISPVCLAYEKIEKKVMLSDSNFELPGEEPFGE